jgi:pyruvate dehydrogenase E2 component (dihydrolipoamide acetyltransferase)
VYVCLYIIPTGTPTIDVLITGLSATSATRAITKFVMPAMSPTMTEGGIASWKKREGNSFTAGDVLLEIVRHK